MDVLTIQLGWLFGYKPRSTPIPPVPPTPVVVVDDRRWPGPPITLYRETDIIPNWQRKREDEEIILL